MPDRIVVALPDSENEYQLLQAADARATAARLGLEIDLLSADNNAVLQIQQLFKAIHADPPPSLIVVEPVAFEGMERVIAKAASIGVGSALLNCTLGYLDRLRDQHPKLPLFAVGSDQIEIGGLQARQILALLPAGGSVLYIQGPPGAPAAEERLKGTQAALAASAIRMLVIDARWSEESAEKAVRGWLRLKTSEAARIDLVAGQDDSIARGARRAFEALPQMAARLPVVPFLGIDGVPSVGQKLVASGQLAATIVMPSNTGPALEAAARFLRSGTLPRPSIRVPVTSFPSEADLRHRAASPPA